MKTGIILAGLTTLAMTIFGCTTDSNSGTTSKSNENEVAASDRCGEVVETADQWGSRMKYLTKRYDELASKDSITDEEFPEVFSEIQDLSIEIDTLTPKILYIIVDNAKCFSAAEVAEARALLDD